MRIPRRPERRRGILQWGERLFKLTVSQAKGVSLEVPEKLIEAMKKPQAVQPAKMVSPDKTSSVFRVLKIRNFQAKKVIFGEKTEVVSNTLVVDPQLVEAALEVNPLVKKIAMDIIEPHQRHIPTNTIMDIMPVLTKINGGLGEGITNYLNGVVVILTGTDENGKQIAEFGSSHGILDEKIKFGMPGTPDAKDIILRIDVVIEAGTGMERRGPLAAHQACDFIMDHIREALAGLPEQMAVSTDVFEDVKRPGKPRILVIKEVGGQGAMHEKLLLPAEPGGVRGARSIIDLGNVPVILSPNEIKDGAIHSVT